MSLKHKLSQIKQLFPYKNRYIYIYISRFVKRNKNTKLEGYNCIHSFVNIINAEIGLGTYIGNRSCFYNTKIGRFCSIGSNVEIVFNNHPTNFVTTYMYFFDATSKYAFSVDNKVPCTWGLKADNTHSVIIGNDVWIGNGVKIKGGVKIGNGAVIGMGAVVTKDVPPYAIVGGCPAKVIRYRFDEETIKRLEESKWYDMPLDKIKEYSKYFTNPKEFLDIIEESK